MRLIHWFAHWQFDGEPAPLSYSALDGHRSAVRLDNVFHNAQPDADALRLAAQLRAEPIESFEDASVFFGRDAFAVVFAPEQDA